MGANGFASTTHNGERNHIKSEQIGEGNLVGCKPEIMRRSADGWCVSVHVSCCQRTYYRKAYSFYPPLPLRCCCAWNREIIKNALESSLSLRLMLYTWIWSTNCYLNSIRRAGCPVFKWALNFLEYQKNTYMAHNEGECRATRFIYKRLSVHILILMLNIRSESNSLEFTCLMGIWKHFFPNGIN